jgi:hypothetical protein
MLYQGRTNAHGYKMMNRIASLILSVLSGVCGAIGAIGYAIPATSIAELTNKNLALWVRILDAVLMWALTIAAFYMSFRLLRIGQNSK